MKDKTRSYLGDLTLLLVAIIWGFGFVAVKIGLENGMSAFYLMFIRFAIAALLLFPFQIKRLIQKKISMKTIKRGAFLGVIIFMVFAFQTLGLERTTTSKNAFLTGVNVVIVPFLAWAITKKKIDRYALSAAFMCLLGIGLLTLNDTLSMNLGDMLTLVCAVMCAVHITVTSIIAKDEPADTLVWMQMLVAAVLSFVFTLVFNEKLTINPASTLAILYLGIFSSMLAFFLQTVGQKYAQPTKAAILLSTESLFGALLAVLFFKDPFSSKMILGCILIFLAIIVSETKLSFLKKNRKLKLEA